MSTLLHIDSSPRGNYSVSHHLSAEFAKTWSEKNAGGKVIYRDLNATALVPVDLAWIGAAYTPEPQRSAEQVERLKLTNHLIDELVEADEYAIGVPMFNFGVPSVMKAWIDSIALPGRTFAYVDGAPKGLLKGKKATFLLATGGQYGPGSAAASLNFVEPYLKAFFGFIGVTDVDFVTAGGTAALNYGADFNEFVAPHVEAVKAKVA